MNEMSIKKHLIVGQTCTFVLYVRETHGKPDVHSGRIFLHHVHLTADVAGGLLDTQEYLFW